MDLKSCLRSLINGYTFYSDRVERVRSGFLINSDLQPNLRGFMIFESEEMDYFDIFKALLDKRFPPPLLLAVKYDRIHFIKYVLENGYIVQKLGLTLEAISLGKLNIIEYLLPRLNDNQLGIAHKEALIYNDRSVLEIFDRLFKN